MKRNIELTRGLVFSPRVLLALVEGGMDRDEAYELVQAHSLAASDTDSDFREFIRSDARVTSRISANELAGLFDYGYFLRFTDAIFTRIGLVEQPAKPDHERITR